MANHHFFGLHRTYLNTVRNLPPLRVENIAPLTDRPHEINRGLLTARMDSGPTRKIITHSLQTESGLQAPIFDLRRMPKPDPVIIPFDGSQQERLMLFQKRPLDKSFESERINKRIRPTVMQGPDLGEQMDGKFPYHVAALTLCEKISELTRVYAVDKSKDLNNEMDSLLQALQQSNDLRMQPFAEYVVWMKALNIPTTYEGRWEGFYKKAIRAADFRFAVAQEFLSLFNQPLLEYLQQDLSLLIEFHRFFLNAWPEGQQLPYYPGSIVLMGSLYAHLGDAAKASVAQSILQPLPPTLGSVAGGYGQSALEEYGKLNAWLYYASDQQGFWNNNNAKTVAVQAGQSERQRLARLWMMGPNQNGALFPIYIFMLAILKDEMLDDKRFIPHTWSEHVYMFNRTNVEHGSITIAFDAPLVEANRVSLENLLRQYVGSGVVEGAEQDDMSLDAGSDADDGDDSDAGNNEVKPIQVDDAAHDSGAEAEEIPVGNGDQDGLTSSVVPEVKEDNVLVSKSALNAYVAREIDDLPQGIDPWLANVWREYYLLSLMHQSYADYLGAPMSDEEYLALAQMATQLRERPARVAFLQAHYLPETTITMARQVVGHNSLDIAGMLVLLGYPHLMLGSDEKANRILGSVLTDTLAMAFDKPRQIFETVDDAVEAVINGEYP
jgi:hypothetical protein